MKIYSFNEILGTYEYSGTILRGENERIITLLYHSHVMSTGPKGENKHS
jgi:hypothetical protein